MPAAPRRRHADRGNLARKPGAPRAILSPVNQPLLQRAALHAAADTHALADQLATMLGTQRAHIRASGATASAV